MAKMCLLFRCKIFHFSSFLRCVHVGEQWIHLNWYVHVELSPMSKIASISKHISIKPTQMQGYHVILSPCLTSRVHQKHNFGQLVFRIEGISLDTIMQRWMVFLQTLCSHSNTAKVRPLIQHHELLKLA